MPLKRRTREKCQGKQKSLKSKESSSEDMDRCTEIVSRLARKYLLKSSTDTEQSDHKENAPSASDPYDADLETSEVDTAASVDTASDMECLETNTLTSNILSPSRQGNIPSTFHPTTKKGKLKHLNCSGPPSPTRLSAESLRKHSRSYSRLPASPTPHKERNVSTAKEDAFSQQSDSGLFISPPPANRPRRYLRGVNASDASTPASTVCENFSDLNDSCFGFDTMVTPDPLGPISPVGRVLSPPTARLTPLSKSAGVMRGEVASTRNISAECGLYMESPVKRKVSAVLDLSSLVQEQQPPVKKVKKRKANAEQLSVMHEWAAKMADQFEDIEMHELNIE